MEILGINFAVTGQKATLSTSKSQERLVKLKSVLPKI